MSTQEAYFRRTGTSTYLATEHTSGGWSTSEQHISPLCGLLVHVLESTQPSADKVLARLSVDILGVVPIAEVEVTATVVRPGRTIELAEIEARHAGRAVARARAWRLAGTDTAEVAGLEQPSIPGPAGITPWPMSEEWPGGYIASLDVRRVAGARAGRATAWVSTPLALVAEEEVGGVARWAGLLDTANGIGVRASPERWAFPNVDLTLHLHRQPAGRWVGLDTAVTLGAGGLGLTSSVVHDEHGPVGTLAQALTVRATRG